MKIQFPRTQGQREAKQHFENALVNKSTASVTLIHGQPGLGQIAMALDGAEILVCSDSENRPCGLCSACREIKHQNSHNIQYVFPLQESFQKNKNGRIEGTLKKMSLMREAPYLYSPTNTENISIAQVRDLKETLGYAAPDGHLRVVMIFFPEKLGDSAANALLKLLEEPPSGTYFLLASESKNSLMSTLLSRCVSIKLGPLAKEELKTMAANQSENEYPDLCVSICQNSPGQLLKLLSYESGDFLQAIELLKVCLNKNWKLFSDWLDESGQLTDMEKSLRMIKLSQEIYRMLIKGESIPWPDDTLSDLQDRIVNLNDSYQFSLFFENSIRAIKRYSRPHMALMGNFLKYEMI